MDFRTLVKTGWWIRVMDFAGHVAIGWMLGSVWRQFLPDILLPIIFLRSWWTNKLLPENGYLMWEHRLFHTLWLPLWYLIGGLLFSFKPLLALSAQCFFHVVWDQVTHPEAEFQKSLWRVNV
jgi:hypothetical protein